MAKDESGRLFSKVAKFVRHPLKGRSELDAQESLVQVDDYSREMVQAMAERRHRNDFIRHREFDMLRKLRQSEAPGGDDAAFPPSAFNLRQSGRSEGRALTLKKIDEIEEQMAQQWWKVRAPSDDVPANTEVMSAQRARAYADTLLGAALPLAADDDLLLPSAGDVLGSEQGPVSETPSSPLLIDIGIEEAAICFARGDAAGSETVLLQTIAPHGYGADHDDNWQTLFDLYRVTGNIEKFEHTLPLYVQQFGHPGPPWTLFRLPPREALVAHPSAPLPGKGWTCSAHLTRQGLGEMMKVLEASGPVWELDWQALKTIDVAAVAPLKALFVHWSGTAVQLRFAGAPVLLAVLAAATPSGDRATAVVWWELRLAVLRAMHEPDSFELVAFNYCLTYEVSPPPWEDPHNVMVLPLALSGDDASLRISATGHLNPAMLAGELSGESMTALDQLDADLAALGTSVVSCAGLLRVDFIAARTLLTWVMARDARGERVEFIHANRLISTFFNVVGIAEHATIAI